MKKLLSLGLMLMFFAIFPSCEKDNPETDIDKIEKELNAFVKDNGITKCTIILNYGGAEQITVADNLNFSISGGFLIVKQSLGDWTVEDRYSLLNILWYDYSATPTNIVLTFYF